MRTRALPVAMGATACFAAAALAQSPQPLDTRRAMIDEVNPAAVMIWDVTNGAVGEDGTLDPALLSTEDWSTIGEGALMLQRAARRMAEAQFFVAGGPENLASNELPPGVSSKEQIQAMIDADPEGFRAVARDLAERASGLLAAARQRDVAATGDFAAAIDEECSSCHTRYWYRQDPTPER